MIEVGKSSSGQFKAWVFSGSLSHDLSSSTPLTITPPAGKVLRLDFLAGNGSILNTSVFIGDNLFVENKILDSSYGISNDRFLVSNSSTSSSLTANSSNTVQPILAFEPGQSITISTLSPVLITINYSYSYGE